mmetsp:Transcript_1022/g.2212  ORF Transcript_1022/g.2212 Transcript_1022/m.2212 type:complete len:192 (-) Transcript_1022:150-725(-)
MSFALFNKDIAKIAKVKVMVDGKPEWVDIHPWKGPLINNPDGSQTDYRWLSNGCRVGKHDSNARGEANAHFHTWERMTNTEQEMALHTVAKKNKKLREWQEAAAVEGKQVPALPDYLQFLPYFIARNKQVEEKETERWLAEKMNNVGISEEVQAQQKQKQKKSKSKERKLAAGEGEYNPPYVVRKMPNITS